MLPKKIILEGKSYLMLEENLGRLKYNNFEQGSINAKHYSDYEPITAVGIAPVDTVTRKTVDKKKVEVQDQKFAIKFQWNVDVLLSNPDLFLRYYNYFEDVNQTNNGKKVKASAQTLFDFMPFIRDPLYGKTFNSFLAGESGDDLEDDGNYDFLSEAETAVAPEEVASEEDAFDGFNEDAPVDPELTKDITSPASKSKSYYFYLVFKYDELYDNASKLRSASYTDGGNIEIIKLVSEGHADEANIAITGRALERNALGFYKEILGILNANHKAIIAAVNNEPGEVTPIAPASSVPVAGSLEEPSNVEELDFDNGKLPPDDIQGVDHGDDDIDPATGEDQIHSAVIDDAKANQSESPATLNGKSVHDLEESVDGIDTNGEEARLAYERFKASGV